MRTFRTLSTDAALFLMLWVMLFGEIAQSVRAQAGPPLLSDDPGTPGNGRWEINCAFTAKKSSNEWLLETPLLDLNYGLGERVQLKYEVPWVVLDTDEEGVKSGLGDSLAGVKWRFLDEDKASVSMSVYPQFEFNTITSPADRGLVDRGSEFFMPVEIQKTFGPIQADLELGRVFRAHEDDEWVSGLVLGHEFSEQIELLAEIRDTSSPCFEHDQVIMNIGTRWKLNETYTLLFSAGRSVFNSNHEELKFLSYLGLQFNF